MTKKTKRTNNKKKFITQNEIQALEKEFKEIFGEEYQREPITAQKKLNDTNKGCDKKSDSKSEPPKMDKQISQSLSDCREIEN